MNKGKRILQIKYTNLFNLDMIKGVILEIKDGWLYKQLWGIEIG